MTTRYLSNLDDRLSRDGKLLVLVADQVMLLSPIAGLIVEICDLPHSVEQIVPQVEAVFGSSPTGDSASQVRALIEDLVDRQVLKVA